MFYSLFSDYPPLHNVVPVFPGKSLRFSQFVTSQALVTRPTSTSISSMSLQWALCQNVGSDERFHPRADETTKYRFPDSRPTSDIYGGPVGQRDIISETAEPYSKRVCTGVNNCEGGPYIEKSQDEWPCIPFLYSERFQNFRMTAG